MESGKLAVPSFAGSTTDALLAALVESSDDAIVGKDLNGTILSWNSGAERMFGYTAAEAIGKPISLIIPDDRLSDMRTILDRIGRGERIGSYETKRRTKDGRILEVSISVSPIRDATGRIVGASKIGRDITAAKAAQREIEKKTAQINALHMAGRTLGTTLDRRKIHEGLHALVGEVLPCDAILISSFDPVEKVIHMDFAWIEGECPDPATFPPVPLAPEGKGFQSQVIRTGKPLLVNDLEARLQTQSVTHYRVTPTGSILEDAPPDEPQTQSVLLVPVILNAEVTGVIQVSSHQAGVYSEDDLALLQGIAYQMAAALRNAELYERVRESESQFRLLANAMPQIAWALDSQGQLDFLNARYRDYTGMDTTTPPEVSWKEIVHPDDFAGAFAGYNECVEQGKVWQHELRLRSKEGQYRWYLSRLVPVFEDGRIIRWFGTGTDIHEKREADERARKEGEALKESREQLRKLNAELERRVEERTTQLREANDEMEGFTYSVSHDLRAPLRAIMSTSMIIIEDFGAQLPPEAKELLDRQAAAAKKLSSLIEDLLQYSRLGRKVLTHEHIDLSAISSAITEEIGRREPSRSVQWEIEPDLDAEGDPNLATMLLQNLLENAFKFTRSKRPAVVHVGRDNEGFFVRDNGVGFDMEYAHKLFRPFERLHRDVDYAGTGIGLANVKRIVDRHGGIVRAESEPDHGTTFHFTLGRHKE